jgi:transposase InsO family protein
LHQPQLTTLANAKAESFIKTLKSEEVSLRQYRDQEEARASIQRFIEEVYNRKRLHSALGYLPPDVLEQRNPSGPGVDRGPTQ